MRKAYRDAGLDFADTDYVECHGTGTPVGDPIEVDAVGRCFARPDGPPLLIGSVCIQAIVFSQESTQTDRSLGQNKCRPQ